MCKEENDGRVGVRLRIASANIEIKRSRRTGQEYKARTLDRQRFQSIPKRHIKRGEDPKWIGWKSAGIEAKIWGNKMEGQTRRTHKRGDRQLYVLGRNGRDRIARLSY